MFYLFHNALLEDSPQSQSHALKKVVRCFGDECSISGDICKEGQVLISITEPIFDSQDQDKALGQIQYHVAVLNSDSIVLTLNLCGMIASKEDVTIDIEELIEDDDFQHDIEYFEETISAHFEPLVKSSSFMALIMNLVGLADYQPLPLNSGFRIQEAAFIAL